MHLDDVSCHKCARRMSSGKGDCVTCCHAVDEQHTELLPEHGRRGGLAAPLDGQLVLVVLEFQLR